MQIQGKLQGKHFNYLFFDNRVATFTIEQTIGTGTTNEPKGIWASHPNARD
jgi:hypothetical protein